MLDNVDTAPIAEPLRATLRMLRKVTKDHASVTPDDMRAVLAAGVTRAQIRDALAVCFVFNIIDRLADAFEFAILDDEAFRVGAKILLSRGYRL